MERFWDKVNKKGTDDCWVWTASTQNKGYGQFGLANKHVLSHRLVYCLDRGLNLQDIEGKCVCHTCDNPPCCNPAHLWLGSIADNARDRDSKDRGNKGVKNGQAKLNNMDIMFVRAWLKSGYTQQSIADAFDVCRQTINLIHKGHIWSHLK